MLEDAVLGALKDELLKPALVEEFAHAYHEEINQKAAETSATRTSSDRQLKKVIKHIDALLDSFAEGIRSTSMRVRLEALEAEKIRLESQAAMPAPSPLRLHPRLPEIYRAKVEKLAKSLSEPEIRDEAAMLLRQLITTVTVASTETGWDVEIKSEVDRMINLAGGKTEQNQCSVKVVAGIPNQRYLQLSQAWL